MGQERIQIVVDNPEEGSTSGISTVNSIKSLKTIDSCDQKISKDFQDQLTSVRFENIKLFQELVESQKSYNESIQKTLMEQKLQIDTLTQLCESINFRTQQQSE